MPLRFPMSVASSPPKLLSKLAVMDVLGISDRSLEKLVKARQFPPPLRLGKHARWAEDVVLKWLELQLEPQTKWEPPKRAGRSAARG